MTSSNSWKLRALIKKNLLILRRNIVSTIFEILFPIALIVLCYAIRQAFTLQTYEFENEEGNIEKYIQNKSAVYLSDNEPIDLFEPKRWEGLSIVPALKICSPLNSKYEPRPIIASIGVPDYIKNRIITDAGIYSPMFVFQDFDDVDKLNEYVKDKKYGQEGFPLICFGISFKNEGHKYDYSLHYFDSIFQQGVKDLPDVSGGLFDQFKSGPDLDSYKLYQTSGYTYIMKLINEYILQQETNNPNAKINFGMVAMPYIDYRSDPFSSVIGYFIPFFIVIAYMCPLCLYVYRMVGEKENKSKEGMKIMGLGEGTYFLSYFIQYIIISLIDSIINTYFLSLLFTRIPFFYLFLTIFLWTLDVFGLIFFFQSFIDKTRVALILSLLIYFVMFFLSMACMDEAAIKALKIVMSIFPPVCIMLGIVLFGKFESHFREFHPGDYTKTYTNYSIFIMNIMQLVDFLFFLFLGYYLQNVLPHEFGIKKPWYFLCTKEYWCGNKSKKNQNKENNKNKEIIQKIEVIDQELNRNKEEISLAPKPQTKIIKKKKKKKKKILVESQTRELQPKKVVKKKIINNKDIINNETKDKRDKNFEGEELYQDKTKPDDALRIQNIVKIFGDGKKAVDNVNLNFYKDEIFALLGHNGAGKTTLISMLTGLYEATEGTAYYDGYDILDSNNMDKFRTILGICPQHDVLFDDLTIREHLEMFCIFKGYTSDNIDGEINKTMHDFELDNIQNITAKNLSAGQRRKLSIAISLIGGSKVIFLDEPSSGMDITSRRNLWDILKRQSEQKIIILTTHYMEEASVLGKRIGIINAGKMKCIGTPLFLIERFGKFMSLNITKEEGADNNIIINFIEKRAKNVEYEILSEEILFRIPKSNYSKSNNKNEENIENILLSENENKKNGNGNNNSLGLTKFFEDLDNNLKKLKIKTYSASMPTLEDVFLNVAAEDTKLENKKMTKQHRKFSSPDADNDKILFETDFREDFSSSGKSKFVNDFKACFHRRFLLTSRDIKGFLMEILCPILLVLVGLLVSQVEIFSSSDPQKMNMGAIGKQTILYGGKFGINNLEDFYFNNMENITCDKLEFENNDNNYTNLINSFVNKVFEKVKDKEDSKDREVDMMAKDYSGYYGSLLILQNDLASTNSIDFIEVLNTRVMHVVPIYSYFFFKKIIENVSPNVEINFLHYPLPLTAELEEQSDQTNNNLVIFFVAIAFSLIPANFVTIIVKEKINNSKHLMRVSGISILAYWIVNYIFELAKYYFTCGICLFLLWAFSFYKNYLYILYLIYGPAMIPMTYILSFLFDSESGAQNGIILLNFLLGALGSTVLLLLRALDNIKGVAKILQYIISLLPSFCFNFGYSLLLNKIMIYIIDYPNEWYFFEDNVLLKKFNLLLSNIIYLSLEFVIYTFILILIECFAYSSMKVEDSKLQTNINDSQVLKEIEVANNETIGIIDENGLSNRIEYAIRVKNLKKDFSTGICSKPMTAIKNMCFCVEPGECFGLLGLNGAGKTTTFKCITQELSPSHGKIYINGRDMRNNFSELSSVFGYCPQFDAIFEYMTVYENLEFYARIKGVKAELIDQLVKAMIIGMSLEDYTKKIAGKLSGGNKRKLSVAISLLCTPQIILLDEPSTGMDPEARRFMWSIIHKTSKKGRKSSVIMTTHSMDEAETLCKRMGIMVNGEFVCLGKANQIKDKYGYGYEIDIRIKPMNGNQVNELLKELNGKDPTFPYDNEMNIDYSYTNIDKNFNNNNIYNKKTKVNKENINDVLVKLNKGNFCNELKEDRLGKKIFRDIELNGSISLITLFNWVFFVQNAFKFIKNVQNYFEEIILSEHIENNFLFKMKKGQNVKSIGFFFGLFEKHKEECFVTEYSMQPTSLEQIFNKFAKEQVAAQNTDKKNKKQNLVVQENKEIKNDILVDENLFNKILY